MTAAATLTLSDSTPGASGIESVASQVRLTRGLTPFPSAPKTTAVPSVRSTSQRLESPSALAANAQSRSPFTSPKYSGTGYWFAAAGLYILAKVTEYADAAIFSATGELVSGHTLKHLAAAGACYAVYLALRMRQPAG